MDGQYTVEEQIKTLKLGRPHVVILGAGASKAAFPDGDANGLELYLTDDLVEVPEVASLLDQHGVPYVGRHFEDVFSDLYEDQEKRDLVKELEDRIHSYFSTMRLPDEPTLYDHLVLSLREKDLIAAFNWDPLLFQACWRSCSFSRPPWTVFLHGNVAVGFCQDHKHVGPLRTYCPKCGKRGLYQRRITRRGADTEIDERCRYCGYRRFVGYE